MDFHQYSVFGTDGNGVEHSVPIMATDRGTARARFIDLVQQAESFADVFPTLGDGAFADSFSLSTVMVSGDRWHIRRLQRELQPVDYFEDTGGELAPFRMSAPGREDPVTAVGIRVNQGTGRRGYMSFEGTRKQCYDIVSSKRELYESDKSFRLWVKANDKPRDSNLTRFAHDTFPEFLRFILDVGCVQLGLLLRFAKGRIFNELREVLGEGRFIGDWSSGFRKSRYLCAIIERGTLIPALLGGLTRTIRRHHPGAGMMVEEELALVHNTPLEDEHLVAIARRAEFDIVLVDSSSMQIAGQEGFDGTFNRAVVFSPRKKVPVYRLFKCSSKEVRRPSVVFRVAQLSSDEAIHADIVLNTAVAKFLHDSRNLRMVSVLGELYVNPKYKPKAMWTPRSMGGKTLSLPYIWRKGPEPVVLTSVEEIRTTVQDTVDAILQVGLAPGPGRAWPPPKLFHIPDTFKGERLGHWDETDDDMLTPPYGVTGLYHRCVAALLPISQHVTFDNFNVSASHFDGAVLVNNVDTCNVLEKSAFRSLAGFSITTRQGTQLFSVHSISVHATEIAKRVAEHADFDSRFDAAQKGRGHKYPLSRDALGKRWFMANAVNEFIMAGRVDKAYGVRDALQSVFTRRLPEELVMKTHQQHTMFDPVVPFLSLPVTDPRRKDMTRWDFKAHYPSALLCAYTGFLRKDCFKSGFPLGSPFPYRSTHKPDWVACANGGTVALQTVLSSYVVHQGMSFIDAREFGVNQLRETYPDFFRDSCSWMQYASDSRWVSNAEVINLCYELSDGKFDLRVFVNVQRWLGIRNMLFSLNTLERELCTKALCLLRCPEALVQYRVRDPGSRVTSLERVDAESDTGGLLNALLLKTETVLESATINVLARRLGELRGWLDDDKKFKVAANTFIGSCKWSMGRGVQAYVYSKFNDAGNGDVCGDNFDLTQAFATQLHFARHLYKRADGASEERTMGYLLRARPVAEMNTLSGLRSFVLGVCRATVDFLQSKVQVLQIRTDSLGILKDEVPLLRAVVKARTNIDLEDMMHEEAIEVADADDPVDNWIQGTVVGAREVDWEHRTRLAEMAWERENIGRKDALSVSLNYKNAEWDGMVIRRSESLDKYRKEFHVQATHQEMIRGCSFAFDEVYNAEETYMIRSLKCILESRESVCICGPPGAGKSTVVRKLIRELMDEGTPVVVLGLLHSVIREYRQLAVPRYTLTKMFQTFGTLDAISGDPNLIDFRGRVPKRAVVIIDEFEIVPVQYISLCRYLAHEYEVKFIVLGDPYQSPCREIAMDLKDSEFVKLCNGNIMHFDLLFRNKEPLFQNVYPLTLEKPTRLLELFVVCDNMEARVEEIANEYVSGDPETVVTTGEYKTMFDFVHRVVSKLLVMDQVGFNPETDNLRYTGTEVFTRKIGTAGEFISREERRVYHLWNLGNGPSGKSMLTGLLLLLRKDFTYTVLCEFQPVRGEESGRINQGTRLRYTGRESSKKFDFLGAVSEVRTFEFEDIDTDSVYVVTEDQFCCFMMYSFVVYHEFVLGLTLKRFMVINTMRPGTDFQMYKDIRQTVLEAEQRLGPNASFHPKVKQLRTAATRTSRKEDLILLNYCIESKRFWKDRLNTTLDGCLAKVHVLDRFQGSLDEGLYLYKATVLRQARRLYGEPHVESGAEEEPSSKRQCL